MRIPTIYLAGAIRDEKPEDYLWREKVIDSLKGKAYFLNPLGGKTLDKQTGKWSMNGIEPGPKVIVKHDFWCVDKSDVVLFNFSALMEKYPNIGTLVEFGRATSTGALLYSVIDPDYTGHSNLGMFRMHPFIEQNSAATFESVDQMIEFLQGHLDVLSGKNPHYMGVRAL